MTQADFNKLDNQTDLNLIYANAFPSICGGTVVLLTALVKCPPPSDEVQEATMDLVLMLGELHKEIGELSLTNDEIHELYS